MTAFLLDANVLIALMWPAHENHTQAQAWLGRKSHEGWATCPFTQAAFLRIITNPAFSRDAVTPQEAAKLLGANLNHPSHRFWPDEISFVQAIHPFARRLAGHQQVTDAYLLGLAIHKQGKLATMDRAVLALLPEKSSPGDFLEVI
jgi:toxin-antitoxin system PIN domain toxin